MDTILSDGWISPKTLASETGVSASEARIRERCEMLHYSMLLEPLWSDAYDLTNWGRLYLQGDLDARHQPEPTLGAVREGGRV